MIRIIIAIACLLAGGIWYMYCRDRAQVKRMQADNDLLAKLREGGT